MSREQPFGNYDLLERVNVGGMAEIFRARVRSTGAICAIKRILPEVVEDEEFVRMFRDEAKVASLLEHPSIAKILDIGRVDGQYFLALEFVEGLDLRGIFERAARAKVQLELGFVLHVFSRVCEGLGYAHQKTDANGARMHLVHRDVSLQNVLVGFDGTVKLIDFGIAKSAGKLSKTQVGTIKGKYAYMSPEQVRGLPLDHRSDIYSLGICLHEMLTLKRLFGADNELLIMERIKEGDLPKVRSIEPSVRPDVEAIVVRALASHVADRYGSALDFGRDLDRVVRDAGVTWTTRDVAEYMRRCFDPAYTPSAALPVAPEDPPPRVDAASGRMESGFSAKVPSAQPSNAAPSSRTSSATPSNSSHTAQSASSEQEQKMSDQKGSDLDVFEGLSSKRADNRRPSVAPPPPPPSRSIPPAPPPGRPRLGTQMGMGGLQQPLSVAPLPPPPRTSTPPMAPPQRSPVSAPPPAASNVPAPLPPPPGRAPVSGPTSSSVAAAAAAAPAPPPPPAAARVGVEMDWDDEDEKTHIYDNQPMRDALRASSASVPAPMPPPPAAGNSAFKGTMVGMGNPLPPPPSRTPSERPLPPPPTRPSTLGTGGSLATPAPIPSAFAQTSTAPLNFNTPVPMGAPVPPPGPVPMTTPLPGPLPIGSASFGSTTPQGGARAQFIPPLESAPARPSDATQIIRAQKGGKTTLVVGLAVAAVAATAGGLYWMSTRPGVVVVNVDVKGAKANEVQISIDGTSSCKGTECRIEGVKPGAHTVKATAGDVEKKFSVSVEAGKDSVANLTLEVAPKVATLKIGKLAQTGVKVSIDGEKAVEVPLTIDDLKPGKHTLKFTAGDKYVAKEMNIDVDGGDTKSISDVKLALSSVKVKFDVATKGAKVSVSDGKKALEVTEGVALDLDASKEWTLTASASGFDDLSRAIKLGDDETQTEKIELSGKGKTIAAASAATAATAAATTAPATTARSVVAATPAVATKPTTAPATPAVAAAAAGGDGSLFINTLPKSNCVVNGTPRGATPMTLSLPAGTYSITCVARDGDETLKKSSSATVAAGGAAKVILKLRD